MRLRGLLLFFLCLGIYIRGESFRIATYNLEGYRDTPAPGWPAKSPESRAQIRENIRALQPDVLALQELANPGALVELQASLKNEGLDLPSSEFVSGSDTNVHLAVLSRFPFVNRRQYTNLSYLLGNRRHYVSRGFSEIDVQVSTNYSFTLITAHLKSRRAVPTAAESELRLEEAKLLREIIDRRLNADSQANLVVVGDLNDTRDAPAIKTIIGRGKTKLLDTRPGENSAGASEQAAGRSESRNINWTHFYGKEDTYSRIDYVLLSQGMVREWSPSGTFVLATPHWGLASDHRPLVAKFEAEDR